MAEFLLALADFDQRRGFEPLGFASTFAFLLAGLGLSPAATHWRLSAARLLVRFPEVIEPLRDGRLCLTTVAELAKVLTEENRTVVLPRFFGASSLKAKELVAELQPREAPPMRTVVTPLERRAVAPATELSLQAPLAEVAIDAPANTYSGSLRAPEVEMTHPARSVKYRAEVEPLTADLRRLSMTVSRQFLGKLNTARDGLSHALPCATTEQVLEAALDFLLEKQARARGLVKKPRKVVAAPSPIPTATESATTTSPPDFADPLHRRIGPRQHVPAAIFRAVWQRDGGRCSWPLDGGGVCGSTHRLELDHVVPWARWGGESVDDLRIVCHAHNALAARRAFGERCVKRYARGRSDRSQAQGLLGASGPLPGSSLSAGKQGRSGDGPRGVDAIGPSSRSQRTRSP
jgi:5-methylcytosine-specific restriction endonuclease McrA